MPKNVSSYILLIGAMLSVVFSILCLGYIIDFYRNFGGIKDLNNINTLGLMAQNSLVYCLFLSIVCSIFEKKKKDSK